MAKSAKKRAAAVTAAHSKKRSTATRRANKQNQKQIRPGTKQSTAIEMLCAPNGTTIDALIKATGWQQHSIRGFLAGVVRKRLKLSLDSAVVEGQRIYRVTRGNGDKPAEGQARRHKS